MATIIFLVVATLSTLAYGHSDDREHLKNDYAIYALRNSGHRLAGWQVLGAKNLKCDMVRRNITTFGYCYQDPENEKNNIDTSKERSWVREVVQQWEKCGGIRIVEEPKCRKGPDFVTINIGDYHPMVVPYVDKGTCQIFGFDMYLSFYTSDAPGTGYRRTEKVHKAVLQMYALHEFGHFLGFDHEHNRADKKVQDTCAPDESVAGSNPVFGTYYITKEHDRDSIMNYCRPNLHYKPWLSETDKKAIAMAYRAGNKKECDAVTKHWKWSKGEGLDDTIVRQLEIEETKGFDACEDIIDDCASRVASCKDDVMKTFYCKKTCGGCP